MINTILNGFLDISMNVINWFLTPIWNLIDNINIGGTTVGDMITALSQLLNQMSTTLVWIIDATGLPPALFVLLLSIYISCIVLRFSIYIVKAILRWWDKIIA